MPPLEARDRVFALKFGPWPKCEFTTGPDPDVGLEHFQWIYSV